jgi:hypothetical protein
MGWIHLDHDWDSWRALTNTAIALQNPQKMLDELHDYHFSKKYSDPWCSLHTLDKKTWREKTLGDVHLKTYSAVDIATGYGLDDRRVGFRVPVVLGIFSSARC